MSVFQTVAAQHHYSLCTHYNVFRQLDEQPHYAGFSVMWDRISFLLHTFLTFSQQSHLQSEFGDQSLAFVEALILLFTESFSVRMRGCAGHQMEIQVSAAVEETCPLVSHSVAWEVCCQFSLSQLSLVFFFFFFQICSEVRVSAQLIYLLIPQ